MYILNIPTDRENINRNDVPGVYFSQFPLERLVQERLEQGLGPLPGTGLVCFEGTEGGDAGGEFALTLYFQVGIEGELKKRGVVNLLTDRRAGTGVSAGGNGEELSGDKTSLKC
jgi:hypothetical protein